MNVVVRLVSGRWFVVQKTIVLSGTISMQFVLIVVRESRLIVIITGASIRCVAMLSSVCKLVPTTFEVLVMLTLTTVMTIALSGGNLMNMCYSWDTNLLNDRLLRRPPMISGRRECGLTML